MSLSYEIIPVTPFQQNCTLLWDTTTLSGVLSDPGGDMDLILECISSHNVSVEKIILTHGHLDHASLAGDIAKHLSVPIYGPHKEDMFWIESLQKQCKMYEFPIYSSFIPDYFLDEGATIQCGSEILSVFHCPGHTPGHVVFYHKESNLLIVGDVLFKGSIGRSDFPKGNYEQLIKSIREKLFSLPSHTTFIPGHGPCSTLAHERKTNPHVADHLFS